MYLSGLTFDYCSSVTSHFRTSINLKKLHNTTSATLQLKHIQQKPLSLINVYFVRGVGNETNKVTGSGEVIISNEVILSPFQKEMSF